MLCSVFFVNCSKDYLSEAQKPNSNEEAYLPETQIFVLGKSLVSNPVSKGLVWPYVSDEGWETARFSIRADNHVTDYKDHPSDLYFGRKPSKDGNNRGKVKTSYPYGHYNDRDYDYEKKDKATGNNVGMFRYVYDLKGLKTKLAILEAPLVVDILGDEVVDLEAAIASGKNVATNTANLAKVNALLDLGSDYLESHVLWYVVKEVGMKNGWHVNGIISDEPVGEPDNIPENVEIDIHQQEHYDWNEIKTSIHIRTDVESLTINIPLKYSEIVEQDDFDIRVYQSYFEEYAEVTHTITHDENGITIKIANINADMIEELKGLYGDGLTIEIFSYTTSDNVSDIWDEIKKSCVISTGKPCSVEGQITSAFYEDEKYDIKVMDPPSLP